MTIVSWEWTPRNLARVLEKRFRELPNIRAEAFERPDGGFRIWVHFSGKATPPYRWARSLCLLWVRKRGRTPEERFWWGPEEREEWHLDIAGITLANDAVFIVAPPDIAILPEKSVERFKTPATVLRAFSWLLEHPPKSDGRLRNWPLPIMFILDKPGAAYDADVGILALAVLMKL